MGLLEKVSREVNRPRGQKGWSEPPFWALDRYRNGLLGYSAPDRERIENDFEGYIDGAYKADGIVFACILTRQLIFSEARFQWREFRNGRPGNLFGTPELALLEEPWPNGTTGELLTRMEVDLSLAGNFYATTSDDQGRLGASATGPGRRISVLRPDWVSIVIGSASGNPYAADARPVGYLYEPRPLGQNPTGNAVLLLPGEVCHYCTDEKTEILTTAGWKTYDQVAAGDVALTLNHDTGLSEWQPVTDVCVFPAQQRDMIRMSGREHSSFTTPDHRWPVEKRNTRAGTHVRRWATSETLGTGDRIPLSAPSADLPTDPKWSDDLVEVVAWFWTEGTIARQHDGRHSTCIRIAQSYVVNPANVARIRAALTRLFGPAMDRIPRTGPRTGRPPRWSEWVDGRNTIFYLSSEAGRLVLEHAPGRVVSRDFLRSLTRAQLELFIQISLLADGDGPNCLAQKDPEAAEAFGFACILAGYAVSYHDRSDPRRTDYKMRHVTLKRAAHLYPHPRPEREGSAFRIERTTYDGIVWCPRTPNQTWLARRDGTVYFTGNSVVPDPSARFRGMSWLTPVLREIASDRAATSHKLKFFEQGAALSRVVSFDKAVGSDSFKEFVKEYRAEHEGSENAHKTLFLGAGADVTVIGTDLKQLDLRAVQGSMETRIAAASGVGAVIAQFSEGMQGSSLNAGNYNAAKRRAGDALFRPLWRTASAALQSLVTPPTPNATLWYDDRDIAFLQEDAKDAAEIVSVQLQAIRTACEAGFDPDAVVDAVSTLDITRLRGTHTGLLSVQLQPPLDATATEEEPVVPEPPSTNGDRPALPAAN